MAPRLFALLLLLVPFFAQAAEPPAAPILRIEADMHTAMIRRVAADAQGRYLVTASDDKTARVWDIASGKLLNVLRSPQGEGNEGRLFAVAMSPDGATVAAGGWTQWNNGSSQAASDGHNIYLFDRASGRMLRRIGGLPNVINNLAWSPDGRYLAAGLGQNNGIRVFRTDIWQEAGRDADYGSDSYGASFSTDNRLVASSWDGQLRLYRMSDSGLNLLAKAAAPGGLRPEGVRFSFDGLKIAVGFDGSSQVNVLDGNTLNLLHAPDTSMVINGKLSSVAWSADGQFLYAGGIFWQNGSRPILRWPQGGRGKVEILPSGTDNTLFDLAALPDGGLLFGSADSAWGRLDRDGKPAHLARGPVADYRAANEHFTLSRDGQTVGFGFEVFGKSPARFDLAGGLKLGEASGLIPPRTETPGLAIRDWKYTTHPTLNGQAFKIDRYETSRSLAIAPDGRRFALGTDWWVRYFDADGKEVWKVPTPGVAWAVNISADERHVVAAFGDGTLRWYDARDGREKLAFFPHADKQRWVAWTPSGYYTASPGGDDLIGWHLNLGKDAAADFFPASRFRSQFYRPDVLARALTTGSEAEALRMANEESGRRADAQPVKVQNILPPVVAIESPQDGVTVAASEVTLRYSVRTPEDAPMTGVRVRVNGQAVPEARNLAVAAASGAREITVKIPPQDSEIQLFAENRNGVSTPATLRVKWAGKKPVEEADNRYKPKLYVLAVGVSKYKNPDYNLGLAAKDAKDFAAVLGKQKGKLYGDVVVQLLTDDKAAKDDVLGGLEWLKSQVTARDVGVMFLAGHGMNDNMGKYFFMPHNADAARPMSTGVAQSDIKDTLNSLAGKVMFFIDTCHSGNALGTAKTRAVGGTTDAFVSELASAENGVIVFSSSTGKQLSQEDPAWGNGAFTKAVVEGLSGKADFQNNGKITHKGLDYYVTERVKELTRGQQSPVSIAPGGITDFPIAVAGK